MDTFVSTFVSTFVDTFVDTFVLARSTYEGKYRLSLITITYVYVILSTTSIRNVSY